MPDSHLQVLQSHSTLSSVLSGDNIIKGWEGGHCLMACGGLQGVSLVDLCHIEDREEKQVCPPHTL